MRLNPHETRAIDLRKLRDAHEPDFQKNTIPANATDGSVLWSKFENVPVMGRMMVVQRHKGIASSYSCSFGCQCGPVLSFIRVTVSPPTVTGIPGDTQQFLCIEEKHDCHGTAFFFDISSIAQWLSSDATVATIDSTGFATAVGGGSANLTGQFTDTEYYWDDSQGNCVETQRTRSDSGRCDVLTASVTNADIVSDQIGVTLMPTGPSGQLVVTVGGSGPSYQPVNQTQSGGSYTFSFQPNSLPAGQYSQVTARWTVSGKTSTGNRSVGFNVLGSYRHSQYNSPNESSCTGSP